MASNFDLYVERRHTDSDKWHKYEGKEIIPLWVADSDFISPPAVIDALQKRVAHGVFGYGYPSPELSDVFIQRMQQLYQWEVKPEWLVFLPGLVCGLNLSVRALTTPEQGTIAPHPIYPPFMKSARLANRNQVSAPIKLQGKRWVLDLEATEQQLSGNEKLLMLCNPHNPGGTIYRRSELLDQLDFAQRHNLIVCSDEIHCDLLLEEGLEHIPFASLSEDASQRSITLMAPSKTFNIAGLGASIAVIPNANLRNRFIEARMGIVPNVDILAYVAATAAYKDGEQWLADQLDYLRGNRDLVMEKINTIPGLKLMPVEATYLAWIDASELPVSNPHAFFEEAGVGLSPGSDFGNPSFVRLNFACHRELLTQALERMANAVANLPTTA
ncbi:MalY/PatB family protein [Pragia fontium]|uniref:cysteine-S-conjugate beta-lyase n=2 Tax=Pragia fontium TaxID=82985 RepID=A0AAJ4WAI0_9GAMM|nr:PatB family C-S lyase [Pragia fontium]GKX61496.1 aspartate aminotransferase [Pragia fontium]SFC78860.1 cystathione beta-lyase [Pragia fontium DSM 5563 = ATCC 49100]SUB82702.1 Cystathionine beta-lyase PatB [Pragia fontium]VEJ55604.1 Cystathionine beta-lyase PatB [Pragia fontium]